MNDLNKKKDAIIEKLKEIAIHVGFGTGTPTSELIKEMQMSGCVRCTKLASELASLQSQPETDKEPVSENTALQDFIEEIEYMQSLYGNQRYTQAEDLRDKLSEKLDDIMRDNNIP